MFKNDRMMTILTGMVLAIFAGTMVKYGDRIMGFMSSETEVASQDDAYSVRAGAEQVLDVLSNDTVKGPIVVLSRPACGAVELTGNNKLSFSSDAACNGEIEFAYCVDAEGACAPNSVRINVISINYAQGNERTQPVEAAGQSNAIAENTATSQNEASSTAEPVSVSQAPAPDVDFDEAPELDSITTVMAPPSLAAPSTPELVSPSSAMASIRQSSGGLSRTSNADTNIATQNSASAAQTTSVVSSAFQAPSMGESNNISLGRSNRTVVATAAAPTSLQTTPSGDTNITQLERGPIALAAMQDRSGITAPQESAPLSTSAEVTSFAPVEVAVVQSTSPTLESTFNAAPNEGGGPIALVAMQSARGADNTAGESLNVLLSEPGEQRFAKALVPPSALAPTSEGPSQVTVLERAPNADEGILAPAAPRSEANTQVAVTHNQDGSVTRSANALLPASTLTGTSIASTGAGVVAARPNQIAVPAGLSTESVMLRTITVSNRQDQASRVAELGQPANLGSFVSALPEVNLSPAAKPEIELASLPVDPATPVENAPAQNSVCEILLTANARNAASIDLNILASCKAAQVATISHAGLSFSVLTDNQGAASVTFPAMAENAEVSVQFEDQSNSSILVNVNDIDSFVRAGVSWQSAATLALNAFEYGAAAGSDGHISPEAPRDYRLSRIKGGGYLLLLGDPSIVNGALAEVYTIPVSRNQQRGTISLSILVENAIEICGQQITAKTSRSREGRDAAVRNVRFAVPECGSVSARITLPNAINDIRLAGR